MSVFAAKPKKETSVTTPIPNAGAVSPEKKRAQRDAFWADALASASILLWIVTNSPNPEQSQASQ